MIATQQLNDPEHGPVERRLAFAAVSLSVERCLARRGLSLDPAPRDVRELMQRLLVLGEDAVLQLAADIPVVAFGATSYGIASAPALIDAIHVAQANVDRCLAGLELELRVVGNRAELEARYPDPECGPLVEELFLALIRRHDVLLTTPIRIRDLRLRRRAPANAAPWVQAFAVLPSFDQGRTVMAFDAGALNAKLRTSNPEIFEFVRTSLVVSTSDRVRAYLRSQLDAPSAATIAEALEMSPRTLQRRLLAEGTTLRALLAEVRVDAARALLANTRHPVAKVARYVGFASSASLARAFKSSMGASPQDYRDKHCRRN